MIKQLLPTAIIAVLVSSTSFASDNFLDNYLKFDGGVDIGSTMSSNPGYFNQAKTGESTVVSLGLGTHLGTELRSELTFSYRSGLGLNSGFTFTNSDSMQVPNALPTITETINFSQNAKVYALMLNAIYDLPLTDKFTAYGVIGAGVSRYQCAPATFVQTGASGNTQGVEDQKYTKNSQNISWQAGGGMSYKVSHEATLEFGYKYLDFGQITRDPGNIILIGNPNSTVPGPVAGVSKGRLNAHEFSFGVRFAL